MEFLHGSIRRWEEWDRKKAAFYRSNPVLTQLNRKLGSFWHSFLNTPAELRPLICPLLLPCSRNTHSINTPMNTQDHSISRRNSMASAGMLPAGFLFSKRNLFQEPSPTTTSINQTAESPVTCCTWPIRGGMNIISSVITIRAAMRKEYFRRATPTWNGPR